MESMKLGPNKPDGVGWKFPVSQGNTFQFSEMWVAKCCLRCRYKPNLVLTKGKQSSRWQWRHNEAKDCSPGKGSKRHTNKKLKCYSPDQWMCGGYPQIQFIRFSTGANIFT